MGFFERLFGKSSSKKGTEKKNQNDDALKVEVKEVPKPKMEETAPVKEEKQTTATKVNKKDEVKDSAKTEDTKSAKKVVKNNTESVSAKKINEEKIASPEEKSAIPEPKSTSDNSSNETITGRFEINRSKDGKKYFFNLYASNKVGIATSQMYSSAQSALIGIKSVIANAATAPIEDQSLKKYEELPFPKWIIYIDKGGKYRFHLCAANGSNVCHSQGYTTKAACKNGIDSIIRSSKNAEIDKTYLAK